MGKDFYAASSEARAVLDCARVHNQPDFLDLLFEGPAETLSLTQIAQPALLAVGIAIVRYLETRGHRPSACAGHSVGEFAALVTAESITFDDAFRLVIERGRCMSQDVPPGTMAAVLGLEADAVERALPESVSVANYNGPGQTIISGSTADVGEAAVALKEAGARRVLPLNVSGPFHSPYMQGAEEAFRRALTDVPIQAPQTRFVSSVTGREVSDPNIIRELLGKQICAPVRWTDVMHTLGKSHAIECGPGKVLQGLAKRMDGAPTVALANSVEAANVLEVNA